MIDVVQLGARMHYAVPKIFSEANVLRRFVTDATGDSGWPRFLKWLPAKLKNGTLRKLLSRRPTQFISKKQLDSYPSIGIRYALELRKAAGNPSRIANAHIMAGRRLSTAAIRRGLEGATAVYAFNSAALDLFREAKRLGIKTIYEQTIAPVRTELQLIEEENRLWPGWEAATVSRDFYEPFAQIEQEEWALSDQIVCGSDFVKESIQSLNGPYERSEVVAYGVDLPTTERIVRPPLAGRKLRVLTVGTVGLRKGAPYVAEAAEQLKALAEFRWVGPIQLEEKGRNLLSRFVQVTGAVPRSEMKDHYQWADVFLLPSICEGSATVTYEALGYGLPIVVTPNTGAPLGDHAAGRIVPLRSPQTIVERLKEFACDQLLWQKSQEAAIEKSQDLTVAAYGRRLMAALSDISQAQ